MTVYVAGGTRQLSQGATQVDTTQTWGVWMLPQRRAIIHGVRRGKCRIIFDGLVIERLLPEAK